MVVYIMQYSILYCTLYRIMISLFSYHFDFSSFSSSTWSYIVIGPQLLIWSLRTIMNLAELKFCIYWYSTCKNSILKNKIIVNLVLYIFASIWWVDTVLWCNTQNFQFCYIQYKSNSSFWRYLNTTRCSVSGMDYIFNSDCAFCVLLTFPLASKLNSMEEKENRNKWNHLNIWSLRCWGLTAMNYCTWNWHKL